MNRKLSAEGAIKSNEKDAHLFVRMLTVMVNMLTLMKTETMGMFFRLDIKNDPANRVGSETTKGALVEIQFNSKLVEKLVKLTSAMKNKFHAGRKSRRKMSTDTDEPTSASDETPNWEHNMYIPPNYENVLCKHVRSSGRNSNAWMSPHARNVQFAPCQNPLTRKITRVFLTAFHFPTRDPPRGM